MEVSYPFLAAKYFSRGRMVEPRALLWHMAEGYGTVSWFTHPTNNVSAHFVIDKLGRITQMVRFTDSSHSAFVSVDPDDRDADDCGIYSDSTARQVLGTGWSDINRYVIAIEVEGFRKYGPNIVQSAAIVRLYNDLRARFPTLRGNLGHRDVQDYKSCPGCLFPWAAIGGHGLFSEDDDMTTITVTPFPRDATLPVSGTNVVLYLPNGAAGAPQSLSSITNGRAIIEQSTARAPKGSGWLRLAARPYAGWYVAEASVTLGAETPEPAPVDVVAIAAEARRVFAAEIARLA